MLYNEDEQDGQGFNITCLRIMVDLDLFQGSYRTFQGEGMHNHVPRGPAIFFKMTSEDATKVELLNYSKDEISEDWPLFFRVGATLPYRILENVFAESKVAPNNARLRVCSWDMDMISYMLKRVDKRSLSEAGDRDRALGWITAVCVRRLYTKKRWNDIDIKTLMNTERS